MIIRTRRVPVLLFYLLTLLLFSTHSHALEKIVDINYGPFGVDISADRRYLVYASPLKYNSVNSQILLLDRHTGESIVVSRNARGENGDKTSFDPKISSDGSYIVFSSNSDNLIPNDQNPSGDDATIYRGEYIGQDIYGYDVNTGLIELISKSSLGVQGIGQSRWPNVSEDGRYIVFNSYADNLVADDKYPLGPDIFVHDRVTHNTVLVNRNAQGAQSTDGAGPADISGDGTKVVFSGGNGLIDSIGTLTNGQIFLKDWQTGEIELVSKSPNGVGGLDDSSVYPAVSRSGDYVAYLTDSLEFVNCFSDREPYARLALYDRKTKQTTVVSAKTETTPSLGDVRYLDLSDDGRYLGFTSWFTDSNSVNRDIPIGPFAFLYDREKATFIQSDTEGFEQSRIRAGRSVAVTDDGSELIYTSGYISLSPRLSKRAVFSSTNPDKQPSKKISIEKTINGEASFSADNEPLVSLLAGRQYRSDYTVKNLSQQRIYDINVFDEIDGNSEFVCKLYALNPGESKSCYKLFTAKQNTNYVVARATARVSDDSSIINVSTPLLRYIGRVGVFGKLKLSHYLNDKAGDSQNRSVVVGTNTPQSWLFKITNDTNIDIYKVKVYNDGVFPLNTDWELLCTIGKIKRGETRYCKANMSAGQIGSNLMMGRAQGNDSYVVGSHQYINAENPTYYTIEP